MKKATVVIVGLVAVFMVLGLIGVGGYNRLIALDEGANTAWAQVENQLQRRYDLIPNLVNTVKGYAEHEREVLTAVTEARSRVGSARTLPEKVDANTELSSTLGRLMVVLERYPDLKANQNFLALQSQLEGTENRISVERRRYNEAVQQYNRAIRGFPTVLIASMMGFERKALFEAAQAASVAPQVKF